jgi:hypothetical protein
MLRNRTLNDVSIVNRMCELASKNIKVEDFSEKMQLPHSLGEGGHVKMLCW